MSDRQPRVRGCRIEFDLGHWGQPFKMPPRPAETVRLECSYKGGDTLSLVVGEHTLTLRVFDAARLVGMLSIVLGIRLRNRDGKQITL